MDLTKLALDIIEPLEQLYNILLRKPFLSVKVQARPQAGKAGEATGVSIVFTVANESSRDMEIQKIHFLTIYNRLIMSERLDAQMPVKMRVNDRATYSVPIEELKPALNRKVGDTVNKVVVFARDGRPNSGRLSRALKEELAK